MGYLKRTRNDLGWVQLMGRGYALGKSFNLYELIGNVKVLVISGTITLVPYLSVKSLQLIWRLGTRGFNHRCPIFKRVAATSLHIQYIPRNMHTVFALLCFVVVTHWLIFPYPSGLLHWHCGNLTIAPVPAKQPWWIWINTSCEFSMNDYITTTKQSTTKPCAYFLGYTVLGYQGSSPSNDHQGYMYYLLITLW